MDNQGFLINTINPARLVSPAKPVASTEFAVTNQAVRLTSYGLTGNDYVQIQHATSTEGEGLWNDVVRNGNSLRLTATNTQHIELIMGTYRVVGHLSGEFPQVAVYCDTDDLRLDNNLQYQYKQGCCASEAPTPPPPIG